MLEETHMQNVLLTIWSFYDVKFTWRVVLLHQFLVFGTSPGLSVHFALVRYKKVADFFYELHYARDKSTCSHARNIRYCLRIDFKWRLD